MSSRSRSRNRWNMLLEAGLGAGASKQTVSASKRDASIQNKITKNVKLLNGSITFLICRSRSRNILPGTGGGAGAAGTFCLEPELEPGFFLGAGTGAIHDFLGSASLVISYIDSTQKEEEGSPQHCVECFAWIVLYVCRMLCLD